MPRITPQGPLLTKDDLARLGAQQVYAQLQQQLRALAAAFPDVVEDNDTPPAERQRSVRRITTHRPTRKAPQKRQHSHGPQAQTMAHRTTSAGIPVGSDALVQVLQATMPLREKLAPAEVYSLVQAEGYRFGSGNHMAALARVLAKMAQQKLVKRTGHARGTRYELLQKSA